MGQSSLIYVLGTFIVLTYMGVRMNMGSSDAMQNSASYYNKTTARNIATSAVDIYLKKLRDNPAIARTENSLYFLGGKAVVDLKTLRNVGNIDTLEMNTRGIFSGDTVRIRNILSSVTAPDSNIVDGAAGISFGKRAEVKVGKNSTLDGRNHNINGDLDTLSAPAMPGLTLGSSSDRGSVSAPDGGVRIRGRGTIDSVAIGASMPDRSAWIDQLKLLATINIAKRGDLNDFTTLGTPTDPKITYVQDFKGKTKFKNGITGAGILIVEGDVKFEKNFSFTGLIIIIGDGNNETVKFNSNADASSSRIIGSLMVVGGTAANRTSLNLGKNTDVLYSKEALAYAVANNTQTIIARYEITDWSE